MGTIVARTRKDGSVGYHALVAVQREGQAHRETKTFDRRPAAAAWIKKREAELQAPGAIARAKVEDPKLGAVIDRYIAESRRSLGKTKAQVLRAIKGFDIAEKRCSQIGSAEIVAFAQELSKGRQPQTVGNYLAHLGTVVALEGAGDNAVASIDFGTEGVKRLLLRYAPVEKL